MAVWEGIGGLGERVREAPAFELPGFRHHLLAETVRDASISLDPFAVSERSPNLWWPDDYDPATGITWDSDEVNPKPAAGSLPPS